MMSSNGTSMAVSRAVRCVLEDARTRHRTAVGPTAADRHRPRFGLVATVIGHPGRRRCRPVTHRSERQVGRGCLGVGAGDESDVPFGYASRRTGGGAGALAVARELLASNTGRELVGAAGVACGHETFGHDLTGVAEE